MGNWYMMDILPLPIWCDIPVAFSTHTPRTEIWECQCCVNKHLLLNCRAQLALISSGGSKPTPHTSALSWKKKNSICWEMSFPFKVRFSSMSGHTLMLQKCGPACCMTSFKGGLIKAMLEPPLPQSMPQSRPLAANLFLVVFTRVPVCVSGADLLYARLNGGVSHECAVCKLHYVTTHPHEKTSPDACSHFLF